MEEKVTMKFKRSFSNHWLMVRLNSSLDDATNWKETTTFVKECEKLLNVRRKES